MSLYVFSTDDDNENVHVAAKTLAVFMDDEVIVAGTELHNDLIKGAIDFDDVYLLVDRSELDEFNAIRNRISVDGERVYIREADDPYPREITLPAPTAPRRYDIPEYLLQGLIGAHIVNCCTNSATFTAWDVTRALRENLKHVNIDHDDVRSYVHEVMGTIRDLYSYGSEDRVQDDGQTARTYFPVTASINIIDALRMFVDDEDDIDSQESTSEFLERLFGKF